MAFIEMNFTSGRGSSPFQFSTDEQKTNLKWLNGEDVYCITRKYTISQRGQIIIENNIMSNLGADKLVSYDMIYGGSMTTGYYASTNDLMRVFIANGNLYFQTGSNYPDLGDLYLTFYYTK